MTTDNEDRGFQTIGDLATKIASGANRSVSTSKPRSPNSETTGAPSQALAASSSTGTAPSTIASSRSLVDEALEARDSLKVEDAAVRLLRQLLRSALQFERRDLGDDTYGADFRLVGFRTTRPLDRVEIEAIKDLCDRILEPTSHQALLGAIHRCLSGTNARAQDTDDIKARVAILIEDLSEFPEDVVVTALQDWRRWQKWWPDRLRDPTGLR